MKFQEKVWNLLEKIPKGRVTTYGIVARKLETRACRAVGSACRRNPYAPKVPCHRVVKSTGEIGNYSGKGGVKTKILLLAKEGVQIRNKRIKNFEKILYKF